MAGPWEQYQATASTVGPWTSYASATPERVPDPTEGMSTLDKIRAGVGKAIVDTGRGLGQMVGLVNRDDVAESRRLDQALMNTTAGKVGNFAGNMALLAPASAIPGAATVPGAALIGAAAGLAQPSTSTGETLTNIGLGGAGGALGQAVGNKLSSAIHSRAQSRVAQQAAANVADAQRFAAAAQGAKQGYVIPPADLQPGWMTEALSGLSGKIKTAQVASQRNQAVTDRLARNALGLAPDAELTVDALNALRNQAGQSYGAVRGSGRVTADQAFTQALDDIASKYQGAARSFPGLQNNAVDDMVSSLRQGTFDAGDAVDATKVLREMAERAFRQGDTGLGKAAKDASRAMEDVLERHVGSLGDPSAVKQLKDARQLIAKTYTVQKALNGETGSVSAPKLAAELAKGKPLTGDLETIARMSQAFPKATQALKEAPKAVSPLDFFGAGLGSVSTGNPMAMGMVAARPAVRNVLLSGPMQRAALQQTAPSRGLLGALDNDLLRILSIPVGTTGGISLAER